MIFSITKLEKIRNNHFCRILAGNLHNFLIILSIILSLYGCSHLGFQDRLIEKHGDQQLMIERWKKAVIHLECATNSIPLLEQMEIFDNPDKPDFLSKIKEMEIKINDIRFHGTALFVIHDYKRYLLTARHVLHDEIGAKHQYEYYLEKAKNTSKDYQDHVIKNAREMVKDMVFPNIYRVPSLDEIMTQAKRKFRQPLTALGAGGQVAYTFSNPELDLAVISLDYLYNEFADELVDLGYEPIDSAMISNEQPSEGDEVFTVGFPEAVSPIQKLNSDQKNDFWSAQIVSLPASTFGKVSMVNKNLPFFWIDMSIYPGNSGGPVIKNNKLVGIISSQAIIPIDQIPKIQIRIPFGRAIQSFFAYELIVQQAKKDQEIWGY